MAKNYLMAGLGGLLQGVGQGAAAYMQQRGMQMREEKLAHLTASLNRDNAAFEHGLAMDRAHFVADREDGRAAANRDHELQIVGLKGDQDLRVVRAQGDNALAVTGAENEGRLAVTGAENEGRLAVTEAQSKGDLRVARENNSAKERLVSQTYIDDQGQIVGVTGGGQTVTLGTPSTTAVRQASQESRNKFIVDLIKASTTTETDPQTFAEVKRVDWAGVVAGMEEAGYTPSANLYQLAGQSPRTAPAPAASGGLVSPAQASTSEPPSPAPSRAPSETSAERPPGNGTEKRPYAPTTQAQVDWLKQNAPDGAWIKVNGKTQQINRGGN